MPSQRPHNALMRRPSELPWHLRNQPFTVAEARAAGLSRRRAGPVICVSPCHGVRTAAATEDSLHEQLRSLAAVTGAIVSHTSAAVLWGFPLPAALERLATIHLTSPPGTRSVRRKGVVGHQQALDPEEITAGRRLVCTSPLRTWFDLAGILGLDDLVIAGDFLLRRRNPLATIDALDAFLAGKRGKPGYRRAMCARETDARQHRLPQGDRTPAAPAPPRPARTRNQCPDIRRDWRLDPGPGHVLPRSRRSRSSTTAAIMPIRYSVATTSSGMRVPGTPGGAWSS